MILILEWVGCATGILGALLVSLNNHRSKWGFVAYLLSNVCWLGFALITKSDGLVAMQVVFLGLSIVGIYNWFARPERLQPVQVFKEGHTHG